MLHLFTTLCNTKFWGFDLGAVQLPVKSMSKRQTPMRMKKNQTNFPCGGGHPKSGFVFFMKVVTPHLGPPLIVLWETFPS